MAALAGFGCSSGAGEGPGLFSGLQEEGVLEMTLETGLSGLVDGKEGKERQPARLLIERDGKAVAYDIEVRARGNMRRNYCSFPPLKLYFDEEALRSEGLSGSGEVKLVTHCQDEGDPWVLKEYLAYRLYNEISNRGFQVQLVRIRYKDSGGSLPDEHHYAFLIEPKQALAARLGGRIVEPAEGLKALQAEDYRRFVLFQYMIGNTDWGLEQGHNVELVQIGDESFPTPVPYDFDNAGLVDADYALPHPSLPIDDVSDRLFQWRGKSLEGFGATVEHFLSKKARLKAVVETFEWLDAAERDKMLRYLDEFFQLIERDIQDTDWAGILNQPNGWS